MSTNSFITPLELERAQNLLQFINQSPSSFHAVKSVTDQLSAWAFQPLKLEEKWAIVPGGKYFVTKNDSAVIAFIAGNGKVSDYGFKIIGSHTDSPGFRIKPTPDITVEGEYIKLNVETYGGPILNTWLDRPLAIAGRVILKSDSVFYPQALLFDSNNPLVVIPNIAIHMNQKVNQGIELNKQKDLLPLLGNICKDLEKQNQLVNYIASMLNVKAEDILDFDLFLYEYEKGSLVGLQKEFISSSRLDDLAMVHASLTALGHCSESRNTKVLACFDNEECGSASKQGAASPFLANVLERITLALKESKEEFFQALARSFIISADLAHAVHPNSAEKHDPSNRPFLNKGPVLKISANQSYTTDGDSGAVFQNLCRLANVPMQKFVNRSDERGGSTIGPISSTQLDIRSVDVGTPILAMHSIRELGGVKDHSSMIDVFSNFYISQ